MVAMAGWRESGNEAKVRGIELLTRLLLGLRPSCPVLVSRDVNQQWQWWRGRCQRPIKSRGEAPRGVHVLKLAGLFPRGPPLPSAPRSPVGLPAWRSDASSPVRRTSSPATSDRLGQATSMVSAKNCISRASFSPLLTPAQHVSERDPLPDTVEQCQDDDNGQLWHAHWDEVSWHCSRATTSSERTSVSAKHPRARCVSASRRRTVTPPPPSLPCRSVARVPHCLSTTTTTTAITITAPLGMLGAAAGRRTSTRRLPARPPSRARARADSRSDADARPRLAAAIV